MSNVSFSPHEKVEFYYNDYKEEISWDWLRESSKREIIEKSVYEYPSNELNHIRHLISSWRNFNICIVFGNLGRQPRLLNYYLDICFGHQENVNIFCRWNLNSHYQKENIDENSDFLFIVEPPFGYTVLKPPHVKHLIVLTSHLNLYVSDYNKCYYHLHLSSRNNKKYLAPCHNLQNGTMFNPPIFHECVNDILPNEPVFLDVRKSKSANEAYLKILTGKEIVYKRLFKILINDRDYKIIKMSLSITKQEMKKHLQNFNWNQIFYCAI